MASCGCDRDGDAADVSRPATAAYGEPVAFDNILDERLELDAGRELYMSTCAACHGGSGQGLPNQGPDLRPSRYIAGATDAELVAFVVRGRSPGDPGNTTGLPMPPRGGNAALSDRHLGQVVKYVRAVQAQFAKDGEQ